jgi:transcriptional regulator with XRE-family HTH domain
LGDPTPIAPALATPASLAKRLRELRHSGFSEARLKQGDVAKALAEDEPVAISTLSAWENVRTPTLPSRGRLSAYARFFATKRSLEGEPHLLPLADLTAEEEDRRRRLEHELFRLRDDDAGEPTAAHQSWRFDDGYPITVICSEVIKSNKVTLGPLSDVDNPNYTRLYSFADADALIELVAHLNASNPGVTIEYRLASNVTANDLINHIVLLGGIAWNDVTRRLNDSVELPVRQVRDEEKVRSGEIFEIEDPNAEEGRRQFLPRFQGGDAGTPDKWGILLEDVAMLARVPNPFNTHRTLTYCNGIHSRGVLGAVRSLTHPAVREDNEGYLQKAFPDPKEFVLLMKVQVLGGETISPSLRDPGVILFQWPETETQD